MKYTSKGKTYRGKNNRGPDEISDINKHKLRLSNGRIKSKEENEGYIKVEQRY